MEFTRQPRTFLLLEDASPAMEIAHAVLQSPLDLAKKVVCHLFHGTLSDFRREIDIIKEFAAGIGRSLELQEYSIASYYTTMFAFQQWFHSSYRARQGKVLESILQRILISYTSFQKVPSTPQEIRSLLKNILQINPNLRGDIDVCGVDERNKKVLLVQLRSRDDTGGTTAKTSLVEALQELLRTRSADSPYEILYLIGIWDERNIQQRSSTIRKFYQALQGYSSLKLTDFERVGERILIASKTYLQLAYGIKEILKAILEWDPTPQTAILDSVSQLTQKIQNWDDLWLAYAIASIEIQVQTLQGISNVTLLMRKSKELGINLDHSSWTLLQKSVDEAVGRLIPHWTEPGAARTLPCGAGSLPTRFALPARDLRTSLRKTRKGETKMTKKSTAPYQAALWETSLPTGETWPMAVNFRELVPEISDTGYLTHSLFYYPAKFIPQIPRFCLRAYTEPGDWVIDPFAGSGTVGLEATLMNRNAILFRHQPAPQSHRTRQNPVPVCPSEPPHASENAG